MGWTGMVHGIEYTTRGTVDRKATLDKEMSGQDWMTYHEILKSAMRGSTYYAAVRYVNFADGEECVFGLVCLTSVETRGRFKEFWYKDMSEYMEPYFYDCPASILNMLSDTDNETALKWRAACREKADKKKAERKNPDSLKNLPAGSFITFTCPYDMSGGTKAGDQITLQKVQKWDGKTYWSDGYYRWKNNLIPEEYTVTTRGRVA